MKVWLGLGSVESIIPSFSKSHAHLVGFPIEVSVKVTTSGSWPFNGVAVKEAFRSTGEGEGVGVSVGVGVGVGDGVGVVPED